MNPVRVRFAPSPTGPLHIGGLRTALYNYLFARANQGTFVLRIEDTDQKRYVPGAEDYITDALAWSGFSPDEGPKAGGKYGPYRQSERRELYASHVQYLLNEGKAYYAFDTEDELDNRRDSEKEAGNHNFRYDASTRGGMRNSLSLTPDEVKLLLESKSPYVVRFRIDAGETVTFQDVVRNEVTFQTDEIGDQVLLKADGLPTYHLANVVDDHLMKISHVIRGEEWLPSTALHVLLYRASGWEMPVFVHLPLLLNPNGKGKLSKRKGADLGFPVFPLRWNDAAKRETFDGFRETGFLPEAMVNFIAFLGWNPGTEEEIFSLEELAEAFTLERINNSGARFDIDKAKWYNQQYLMAAPNSKLAPLVQTEFAQAGREIPLEKATAIAGLLKERVHLIPEFYTQGTYFVEPVTDYEEKTIRKKWKPELRQKFDMLADHLNQSSYWTAKHIKQDVVDFMGANELGFGQVLPIIRVAISGTVQGPDAFGMLEVVGQEESVRRLRAGYDVFDGMVG
ncbi:glutamate--tRNA ligase [Neolewinella antarctica]|uniref:Glutamate--tRNA ligase n=1 Tax=Neolewinella antarctica TaxID=442734 RepID=A0ABX0XFL8_9BACT|nr:glutamate--tRNA ligase [Neolewinella antarctica]NJC27573.1 glutamyl-tRNA synthetase [Neolewinella antarctica]